jgi:ATP-binding cassette subfamily F protein 3
MATPLQVVGLSRRFGSRAVLEDASAAFPDDARIGVLGRNGAGKSTLIRILAGEEEADEGRVVMARDLRLGILAQHDPWDPSETVEGFLERYTGCETWRCAEVAARMALRGDLLQATLGSLPGGLRTRVKLAAMMLGDPDYLLLDEPTNFLDLSTLLLLQDFIASFKGGALIVSHDREFLKRTCNQTLEVENGQLNLFSGPLEDFLEWKEEQRALAERVNAATEKQRDKLEKFITRFGAKASKATQAKSKAREIERLRDISVDHILPVVRIPIPKVEPRKGNAFRCMDLSIGYPERTIARDIHFDIERGSRVAVVGDNGQGKTTFLRTLAGDLQPVGGELRVGHGVEVAYYAQHVYEALDPSDTVLSCLEKGTPIQVSRQDVLDMAGCFLFRGEEVQKSVSVLSGGERARLCLASVLLRKTAVLLLDEPTNHLDFETVEALADALKRYDGTVLFISHDRTFVHMVATQVVEVDGGRVRVRAGSYDDYVDELEQRARRSLAAPTARSGTPTADASNKGAPGKNAPAAKPAMTAKEMFEEGKRRRAERTRAATAVAKAEKHMTALRAERAAFFAAIEGAPNVASSERYRRLHDLEESLAKAEEEWLAHNTRLEALDSDGAGPA